MKVKINEKLECKEFPCLDINKDVYFIPRIDLDSEKIKLIMILEAMPQEAKDYVYSQKDPEYMKTLLQAFNDAGNNIESIQEIICKGIYITSAIKCAKIDYGVSANTIRNCSYILEEEIKQFPNIEVLMLMGDVAIKSFNYISKRTIDKKTIPKGSTYKIRKDKYYYNKIRVFPSYLPIGKNYLIEKAKRVMIAEDLGEALRIIKAY